MLSCIPTRWYQLSPIRLADGPPFSPERSCVLHAFLLLAFAYLPFYKNAIRRIRLQIGFANLLLHPLTSNLLPFFYARSRESNMDSCRPVNAKRSHRLKNGVAIFADSKQSLRPLSFLSRTGNLLHAFLCSNTVASTISHPGSQTRRSVRPEAYGASFQTKKHSISACFPLQ